MLAAVHRLRSSSDFATAVRRGARASSPTVVVHLLNTGGSDPVRVGFIVSKAVGNAVVRNRVKRQLRHLAREQLPALPGSSVLVVRALPAAARAGRTQLSTDFAGAVDRVVAR